MWDEREEDIHKEKKMKKQLLHEKHAHAHMRYIYIYTCLSFYLFI